MKLTTPYDITFTNFVEQWLKQYIVTKLQDKFLSLQLSKISGDKFIRQALKILNYNSCFNFIILR